MIEKKPKTAKKSDLTQDLRLNKFLAARTGVSRREADGIIKEGRVIINGKSVKNLATFVNPGDEVNFDGKKIVYKMEPPVYIMLNKPQGYID
ncbi:MAG: S4 domain-containing protein, partial [Deltaproteobacteria bacterium]|nr:S4 domain-containing protein [Deltaproteobacteria bacterium]